MTWGYFISGYIFLPVVLLAYAVFGVWVAKRLASKRASFLGKAVTGILVVLLLWGAPLADVAIGRTQFSRLCESSAAVRVFRTVALDPKYFGKHGSPNAELMRGKGGYRIGEGYVMSFSRQQVFRWPRIEKSRTEIRDIENSDVVAERVNFTYWGGWLYHALPGHHSGESCPQLKGGASLERMVFQPQS
jgi:hypothetical protein